LQSALNESESDWLARFQAGERELLEAVYREHFVTVERAVGRLLSGPDQENVIHDVFYRLLASESLRQGFRGGSLAAWLHTVARNQAIDYLRQYRRKDLPAGDFADEEVAGDREAERTEARLLIEQFRREKLPAKWEPVFQARFIEQLDQREAARRLNMRRTTLAYQEFRIRQLLERFFRWEGGERG
jgi:RNA polymerase sigma-70 factor, ECF subfamily